MLAFRTVHSCSILEWVIEMIDPDAQLSLGKLEPAPSRALCHKSLSPVVPAGLLWPKNSSFRLRLYHKSLVRSSRRSLGACWNPQPSGSRCMERNCCTSASLLPVGRDSVLGTSSTLLPCGSHASRPKILTHRMPKYASSQQQPCSSH